MMSIWQILCFCEPLKAKRALDAAFAHSRLKVRVIGHFTIVSWAFQAEWKGFFTTFFYCSNLDPPLHSGGKRTIKTVDCKRRTSFVEGENDFVCWWSDGHSLLRFLSTECIMLNYTTFGPGNREETSTFGQKEKPLSSEQCTLDA